MEIILDPSWEKLLAAAFAAPSFARLAHFVDERRACTAVYPPADRVFAAFAHVGVDAVKVVVFGQDPYHEEGQAQGLAFHVPPGVTPPPSLRNVAKELAAEYPEAAPAAGGKPRIPDLVSWAAQGVLLLNATLTVDAGRPGSHRNRGWEEFTDAVVRRLSAAREGLVFLLWGNDAKKKGALVDRSRHFVLEAAHPSPLSASRGFFGCGHFRRANEILAAQGRAPIRWL